MLGSAFLTGSNPVQSTNIAKRLAVVPNTCMILRQGVQASYIILEGYAHERERERKHIRDWCLEQGMVIDAHEVSSKGRVDETDQTVVRFFNREDAMLCYLTLKS
jgi:hypothetical protein